MRSLFKLREERSNRRELQGRASITGNQAQASGRKVISLNHVDFNWGERCIVRDFASTIWRGDKIGVVGLNGSGKSTLLQLMLKKLDPTGGTIEHGTKLEVAYFDQHKAVVNENLSVAENVAPNGDTVIINGNSKHILSYLRDFLFLPETARAPARMLSGGERARLLLAKLFLQPANLLVMDEPTNDLDIETIELLEERLLQFEGTLLLVSHDRAFLNNVVTATLALDGTGGITEYAGGCDRWLEEREQERSPVARPKPKAQPAEEKPRKLLNKEKAALLAFDTGPANAPLNDLMRHRLGQPVDQEGRLAATGQVNPKLLSRWKMHPYFSQNVPKSLDRNAFSAELADLADMSLPDSLATAVGFAAFGVAEAVERCPIAPAALYLCGGGRHNLALCDAIRAQVACPVQPVEAIGLNGDMLEAQAFAYLAVRVLRGLPISAPMTTGVSQPISGGRIADLNF